MFASLQQYFYILVTFIRIYVSSFQTAAGKEDNIQLFACIYEASMIERKAGEKNVSFEMTIGMCSILGT